MRFASTVGDGSSRLRHGASRSLTRTATNHSTWRCFTDLSTREREREQRNGKSPATKTIKHCHRVTDKRRLSPPTPNTNKEIRTAKRQEHHVEKRDRQEPHRLLKTRLQRAVSSTAIGAFSVAQHSKASQMFYSPRDSLHPSCNRLIVTVLRRCRKKKYGGSLAAGRRRGSTTRRFQRGGAHEAYETLDGVAQHFC